MTKRTAPETVAMALVDCPLCDHPAVLDLDLEALDCPVCGVRVELAADPEPALPIAA